MTVNVNQPQTTSRAAMVSEAGPAPRLSFKGEALSKPSHNLESVGAANHIRATRSTGEGNGQVGASPRAGVISSIPVSTDWAAIEDAFSDRNAQRGIYDTDNSQGGMD